ncbi:hypothetical protein R1sor_025202 [Riccia sorocarpa]|uniref:Reverse transcriptase domain-containing protein n=1 Tax=Riccia sorocarpa TaxID=122646 RepID=A0ABD3G9X9_9MARC
MITPQNMKIVSWNINGTAGDLRGRTIRRRIKTVYKDADILALQELKTSEFELEQTLGLLAEGCRIVVDYKSNGWGGCALIIKPTYQVVSVGVKGIGQAAWAKVQTGKSIVGILGIYAPHSDRERMELCDWISQLVGEDQWVITGDLNMVETGLDTNCISPILEGDEVLKWMEVCQELNLSDCYTLAAIRVGSRFTRFQVKGAGVEMSRLDRLYFTGNEEWVDYIAKITHDNRSGISDHSPVIVDLRLVEGENQQSFRKSVKLSVEDFREEGVREKAIAAWQNDSATVTDPRVRWDLGWRRVKTIIKEARRDKKQKEISRSDLEKIMLEWMERLERDNSASNRDGFKLAVGMLKAKDDEEARIWRQRSRAKWMSESETPTKYFFSLWKANMKQEEIRGSLQREDGSVTECREQIMQEIGSFYTTLFQDEGESTNDREERRSVLRLINKRVSVEQNEVLVRMPRVEDLDECVANLARDKAPGLDGLISRIIADRIKVLMPGLVSGQQTGFIPGRTIFDNILSLKLGEEWAVESGQEAIFLKLDFIKAYDRVRHSFLWDTLAEMDFCSKIIRLIQGLMRGAEALVHQNGDFTEPFCMERGVRQGCPLAPFLFSLTTEPLMLLLQKAADEGRLVGIRTVGENQLIHSLFADDTGLCLKATQDNFEEAKSLVEQFERISGARLNVAKSLIIPIGLETIPRWVFEMGCRVASEGEVWTYLGTPTCVRVSEEQLEMFLLEKLTKRVNHWSNRLLSWEGRCVVLKHALTAMPNYFLMTLGLTQKGYVKLDRVCWQFLWGRNSEGQFKKPLILWDRICREKMEGGLGLCTFRDQAATLKMRLVTRILDGEKEGWIELAEALITTDFNKKKVNHGKDRNATEILLLEKPSRMMGSRTMKHILIGWRHGRDKVHF